MKGRAVSALKRIFIPHGAVALLIVLAGGVSLYFAFTAEVPEWFRYAAYLLSAWALCIICVRAALVFRRGGIKTLAPVRRALELPGVERYVHDRRFRGEVQLWQGLFAGTAYAVFKLVTGAIYGSAWFICVGVYYLLLGLVRCVLAFGGRRAKSERAELRLCLGCGGLMFLVSLGAAAVTVNMVVYDHFYAYPGYVIYASALYAFWALIQSVLNVARSRSLKSPLLAVSRLISLDAALMGMLALQTAMLAAFGDGGEADAAFRFTMNAITGSVVNLLLIALALGTVCRFIVELRRQKST